TIFGGNLDNNHPLTPDVAGGAYGSRGYNLIGAIARGRSDTWALTDQLGSPIYSIPFFMTPLGDYGGPTQTMALLPASPALGRGDPALSGTTDQRGISRDQGHGVDVGAFQ